ncbi:MAG: hypothetical protein KF841_10125 [Phycisphaerae bacterium]|nr:hypothetical protein [Phycisphaerae bacterium]
MMPRSLEAKENRPGGTGETKPRRLLDLAIMVGLLMIALWVYEPALAGRFVTLDDYMYVVDNDAVRTPSFDSVRRFFSEVFHPTTVEGYYQPLTMLSLMLDAAVAGGDGLDPFYYHLTNVILHGLNGMLVFGFMRLCLAGRWAAAAAALVFLLHPAQVESVAWISQRKTVLAAFFGLSAMIAYLWYGRTGGRGSLVVSVVLMTLAALAKPIVLPLPIAMMLLDIHPLRRFSARTVLEKLSFLPVVAFAAYVAWRSQAQTAVLGLPRVDSFERAVNWCFLVAYNFTLYLGNVVWPTALSPFRSIPSDGSWMSWTGFLCAMVVGWYVMMTALSYRRCRSLFVGLVGFAVLLSPGLGGVHFTATCVADRFLYLPLVFLLIPLTIGLDRWVSRCKMTPAGGDVNPCREFPSKDAARRTGLLLPAMLAAGMVMGCVRFTLAQQRIWVDSRVLWTHIHEIAPELPMANYHVATFFLEDMNPKAALPPARQAAAAEPANANYQLTLARVLTKTGAAAEAKSLVDRVLSGELGNRRGFAMMISAQAHAALGEMDAARSRLAQAEETGWTNPVLISEIGDAAMMSGGHCDDAVQFSRHAVELAPGDVGLRYALAERLRICGRAMEALTEYDVFLRLARASGRDVTQIERAVSHLRHELNAAPK